MVRGRSSSENALLGTKKAGTCKCLWRPAVGTLKIRYLSWGQRTSIEHAEGCAHGTGEHDGREVARTGGKRMESKV